jgi:hypothetical protein
MQTLSVEACCRPSVAALLQLTLQSHRRPGAPRNGCVGFTEKDLAWLLTHAPGETLVLKPRAAA